MFLNNSGFNPKLNLNLPKPQDEATENKFTKFRNYKSRARGSRGFGFRSTVLSGRSTGSKELLGAGDKLTAAMKDLELLKKGGFSEQATAQVVSEINSSITELQESSEYSSRADLQHSASHLQTIADSLSSLHQTTGPSQVATQAELQSLMDNAQSTLEGLQAQLAPSTTSGTGGGDPEPEVTVPDVALEWTLNETYTGSSFTTINHQEEMMLDEGTIEVNFNASDVDSKQGIFSKDSSGYDNGGHVTAYIDDGQLHVRMQDTSSSYTVSADIEAGEHSMAISFGDDGLKLYLDGELQDTHAHTGGLGTSSGGSGNDEPIMIGASGMGTGNQSTSGARDYFTGSVSTVKIYDEQLSSEQIAVANGIDPSTLPTNPQEVDIGDSLAEDGYVHYQLDQDFNGTSEYVGIAHDSALEMNNGTIEVRFTADDTNGNQGLFSKDSSGYDDGGHFTLYMDGDDLVARIQSTSSTTELRASNVITAGQEHTAAVTFGDDGFKLVLDGQVVDTDSYTGGLGTSSGGSGNEEPFAIGANTWGSGNQSLSGTNGFFNGTVSDVVVWNQQLDTSYLADRTGGDIRDFSAAPDAPVAPQDPADVDIGAEMAEDGSVHYMLDRTFSGSSGDYVGIQHHEDLELDNGTIEMRFTADDTNGRQGIFSKDSSGYDTGGHLTVYMDGDDLVARLQSTTQTYEVRASNALQAGTEYDAAVSFGEDGFKLYLDGQEVDSESYTGGLGTTSGGIGNEEPFAIGANTWGSGNKSLSNTGDEFDGVISDVVIHNSQLDASTIQSRAGADIRPEPEPEVVEGGEATGTTTADNLYNDVGAMLTRLEAAEGSNDLQDTAQQTYHALSNALAFVDETKASDAHYAAAQAIRADLVAQMDAIKDHVSDIGPSKEERNQVLDAALKDIKVIHRQVRGAETPKKTITYEPPAVRQNSDSKPRVIAKTERVARQEIQNQLAGGFLKAEAGFGLNGTQVWGAKQNKGDAPKKKISLDFSV